MNPTRPQISDSVDLAAFIRDMIDYRKKTEKGFSILSQTRTLRKISPSLVSLIIQKKRKITLDRVDEIAKLLALTSAEKHFFKSRIEHAEESSVGAWKAPQIHRKIVSESLLSDWLNVYVKDFFQIEKIQKNPALLYHQFIGIASKARIDRALEFLLREGYLRRTLDYRYVLDTALSVADPGVPSKKIRQFHRAALGVAKQALELYSPKERVANTFVLVLNEESYTELGELLSDFNEQLRQFAEKNKSGGDRLYQVVIHTSPVGGIV